MQEIDTATDSLRKEINALVLCYINNNADKLFTSFRTFHIKEITMQAQINEKARNRTFMHVTIRQILCDGI
jgi:hypothetical protein